MFACFHMASRARTRAAESYLQNGNELGPSVGEFDWFQADWRQLEQGFWLRDMGSGGGGGGSRSKKVLKGSDRFPAWGPRQIFSQLFLMLRGSPYAASTNYHEQGGGSTPQTPLSVFFGLTRVLVGMGMGRESQSKFAFLFLPLYFRASVSLSLCVSLALFVVACLCVSVKLCARACLHACVRACDVLAGWLAGWLAGFLAFWWVGVFARLCVCLCKFWSE